MKVLDKLPDMPIRDTVQLWRNALVRLDQNPKDFAAQRVLEAVGKEWNRRATIDPTLAFHWPTTQASGGDGRLVADDWRKEGLLGLVGYRVGQGGESQSFRRRVLSEIFAGPIPAVSDRAYVDEWGTPNSVARLRKLAESIASFARNAKRKRGADMQAAVDDWEDDLQFLHDNYYTGRFQFGWPDSGI